MVETHHWKEFVNRLLTVPLETNKFQEEQNIMKNIAIANVYMSSVIDDLIINLYDKHKRPP